MKGIIKKLHEWFVINRQECPFRKNTKTLGGMLYCGKGSIIPHGKRCTVGSAKSRCLATSYREIEEVLEKLKVETNVDRLKAYLDSFWWEREKK